MNQYPETQVKLGNIRMSKEPQTVKLRIYKVYTLHAVDGNNPRQRQSGPLWKEVNILDKLGFELDDGEEKNDQSNANGAPEHSSPLAQLEMYHIEMTGVCTDNDRNDFTRMMQIFA